MKKSKTINIRVTEDFAALLKSEAKRSGLSQSDLIEAAVKELSLKGSKMDYDESNYTKDVRDAIAYHVSLWTNNNKTPDQ